MAYLAIKKLSKNLKQMTETQAHSFSSDSTQQELSNEYQHDQVSMVFQNLCILVLWTKVLEGLTSKLKAFHCSLTFAENREPSHHERRDTCLIL